MRIWGFSQRPVQSHLTQTVSPRLLLLSHPRGPGSVWRWVRTGADSMEMGNAQGNALGLGSKSRKQRNGGLLLDRTGERKATNSF